MSVDALLSKTPGIAELSAPSFVGRDREIAVLGQALARRPVVLLVEGEAGIGKSRLVNELFAAAAVEPLARSVAVCPPYRESLTLGPIVDALRQAADQVRGLGLSPLAGALRPMFPDWAAELPPALEPLEDAAAARHRLFRAFAELLTRLGLDLLVVEDVHWADEATLEFLLFLVSHQPTGPSLLLTYRPEDVPADSLLRRLTSRSPAGATQLRVTLGALDVQSTTRLVSSMLSGEPLSADFARFMHQRTDGVPLALEELVRLMHDRADLAHRDGGWVRRELDDIVVPPTIRDAVLERVDRLGVDARTILRAAAVLTDPTAVATLVEVSGLPADRAGAGLSEALAAGLLNENTRGLLGFRHVLNCRAVYETVPLPQRRAMHLGAGQALEGADPHSVTRLVRHFREAGETADWCRCAERAADLAIDSGDETAAGALLHDIITNANLPAGAVIRLTEKIPWATFTGSDRFRDVVRSLRVVLDSGNADPRERAEVRFHLGRMLALMEDYEASRVELERAVPQLTHRPMMAARAMLILGWPRGSVRPASAHRRWLRRATEAMVTEAPADRLRVTVDRASALLMLGDPGGWAEASRVPENADTPRALWEVARGKVNIADGAVMWGRYAQAELLADTALELADRHQYLRIRDLVRSTQVHLRYLTGDWSGLAEQTGSLAASEHLLPVSRLESVLVGGLLLAAAGDSAAAVNQLQLVIDRARRHAAVGLLPAPAAGLAALWLADGRVADALAVTDEPYDIVSRKEIWLWADDLGPARVDALLAAGRLGDATELVAEFGRGLRGCTAPAPRAGLATCQAAVVEGRGDHRRAAAAFARAAAAWGRLPRPYDALRARERQARCLLAAGRPDDGLALLSRVFGGYSELGAGAPAARALQALRDQGVEIERPRGGRRTGYGDQLSPRELEVVRLLVGGRTNREIAVELVLSPKTVARHLSSAMHKLRIQSRTALAVWAVESSQAASVVGDELGHLPN